MFDAASNTFILREELNVPMHRLEAMSAQDLWAAVRAYMPLSFEGTDPIVMASEWGALLLGMDRASNNKRIAKFRFARPRAQNRGAFMKWDF